MAICLFTIATVLGIYSDKSKQTEAHIYPGSIIDVTVYINDTRATYCILALLCMFVACFALSWGPLGWIYPAEIYPQLIRAKAMGVTTASSYCFNVAISQIAPVLFRYITWGTYVVFGCSCVMIAWIVHVYYPETRVMINRQRIWKKRWAIDNPFRNLFTGPFSGRNPSHIQWSSHRPGATGCPSSEDSSAGAGTFAKPTQAS